MENNEKSQNNSSVFETNATYYNQATGKWQLGTFILNKHHFQFVNVDKSDDQFHLCIPLSTVSGIEKRYSSFIYPAIVLCIGSEKHWFSSFENRDTVFNLVELFWRESLLSRPHNVAGSLKVGAAKSSLGKELLNLIHESECTLIETANALADQGSQLSETQMSLEDANKDLDVLEKALRKTNLSLALGAKIGDKIRSEAEAKNAVTDFKPRRKCYKVTYSYKKISESDQCDKGTLIITDEITLQDEHKKCVFKIGYSHLEKLQVLSPWELCVTYSNDEESKVCYMTCPQLSRLLKYVSSIAALNKKVCYGDDDFFLYETASCSSTSSYGSALSSPERDIDLTKDSDSAAEQVQEADSLSDEDIQKISDALNNLQSLASEVSKEQRDQMEKITALITDMDNTELRMKADNKKVKKLS